MSIAFLKKIKKFLKNLKFHSKFKKFENDFESFKNLVICLLFSESERKREGSFFIYLKI